MTSAADGTREAALVPEGRVRRFARLVKADLLRAWEHVWAPLLFVSSGLGLLAALPLTFASVDGSGPTYWEYAVACWAVASLTPAAIIGEWLVDRWRQAGE